MASTDAANNGPRMSEAPSLIAKAAASAAPRVSWGKISNRLLAKWNNANWDAFSKA
jgi:hypothetical protein